MNATTAAPLDHEIAMVAEVVMKRTVSFMRDEVGLLPTRVTKRQCPAVTLELRDITAIVGVGSKAGLYIAYSYDEPLIRLMMQQYTADIVIAPDEEALYVQETASDIVNVIIGNCTADLSKRGETVNLSPPVLLVGARVITGRPGTMVTALTLHFEKGLLDVAFVGPKILFDEQLNYLGRP